MTSAAKKRERITRKTEGTEKREKDEGENPIPSRFTKTNPLNPWNTAPPKRRTAKI
jgi:hypothetical protein